MDSGDSHRYSRQICLPEVGPEGQARLRKAKVLLAGLGGLGSPAALYLSAAGIGHLTLVDPDRVDESNLQRQVLYGTPDHGSLKTERARSRLRELNPFVNFTTHVTRVAAENAPELLSGHDVVIDATDCFAAKALLSDTCAQLGIPLVHGSISGFEGRVTVFAPPAGPCYRCLYPEAARAEVANAASSGVVGALAGITGSMQAIETIKLIVDSPLLDPLIGRLWVYDSARARTSEFMIPKRSGCEGCKSFVPRQVIPLGQP